MYFDRAKTQDGSGAECVLIVPYNRKHLISSRLEFEYMNNIIDDPDLNRNATNYRDNHKYKYAMEIILHFITVNY